MYSTLVSTCWWPSNPADRQLHTAAMLSTSSSGKEAKYDLWHVTWPVKYKFNICGKLKKDASAVQPEDHCTGDGKYNLGSTVCWEPVFHSDNFSPRLRVWQTLQAFCLVSVPFTILACLRQQLPNQNFGCKCQPNWFANDTWSMCVEMQLGVKGAQGRWTVEQPKFQNFLFF